MAPELARAGAEVTIPARTQAKADDAVTRIRAVVTSKAENGGDGLSSLKSVRAFAAER
jgi:NAD(P)-dependent dehydrogenase (short-subunit alcohol dehydrogenase family)